MDEETVIAMKATIYLVEDEENLNRLLTKYLEKEGYEVAAFLDGESAVKRIKDLPDLWILDIMLPDVDGYQIIKEIKAYHAKTPVIFISARNEQLDRVVGLELGSDDYLTKPFLPRELIIRTNKLLERVYTRDTEMPLTLLGYSINEKQRTVSENGQEIMLTPKEFVLLSYLITNKNLVVNREQILEQVWGDNYFGSDRVVDDTIRRLRKKMSQLTIETLYGFGYKLVLK